LINSVIDQLAHEGLQSDQRFTESYLHSRLQKGYGPVRLKQELRERGIAEELIEESIGILDINWMDALHSVREKKFGKALPSGYKEQAREARFLQYRGYSTDLIRRFYNNNED